MSKHEAYLSFWPTFQSLVNALQIREWTLRRARARTKDLARMYRYFEIPPVRNSYVSWLDQWAVATRKLDGVV